MSLNVVQCPTKEVGCLYDVNFCIIHRGSMVNGKYYATGMCAFPYQGNLCAQCAEGYAKFGSI